MAQSQQKPLTYHATSALDKNDRLNVFNIHLIILSKINLCYVLLQVHILLLLSHAQVYCIEPFGGFCGSISTIFITDINAADPS